MNEVEKGGENCNVCWYIKLSKKKKSIVTITIHSLAVFQPDKYMLSARPYICRISLLNHD